jgi:hypothetical protein
MQDFPSNSKTAKTEQPREKIERVTSAEAVRRRGLGQKFRDVFIGGDARSATEQVLRGVIAPAFRDMLLNSWNDFGQHLIQGESRRPRPTSTPWYNQGTKVDYTPYNRMGPASAPSPQRALSRADRARHNFNGLYIPTLSAANEVLDQMYEILFKDGMVTVAELYELTGIEPSHTDMKWGWTSLTGSRPVLQRDGRYLLSLPRPEALA